MPQRLFLFVGAPGAGKTTVAKLLHKLTGAAHLWADRERQAMFSSVTHSNQESTELYQYLNQKTDLLLGAGKSVIFDTNFNYRKDRDYVRHIADKYGAETVLIWLTTPSNTARGRALHSKHRDRNGYDTIMSAAEFEQLVDHLERPEKDEKYIKIDGTKLDTDALKRQLGI